jgi:hypothetical protein
VDVIASVPPDGQWAATMFVDRADQTQFSVVVPMGIGVSEDVVLYTKSIISTG